MAPSTPSTPAKVGVARWRVWLAVLLIATGIPGGLVLYQQSIVRGMQADLARQCRQARASQDWPQVEELARQWATCAPQATEPWMLAAEAAEAMGQPQVAAGYLMQMGDSAPLKSLLALSQLQMERLNQPLAAYDTLLKTRRLYPQDTENHQRLLFYYTMTCQHDQTLAEAQRAIEAGGDTRATYVYRLAAHWLTYKNGFDMNRLWLESAPESELFYVAAIVHLLSNQSLEQMAQQQGGSDGSTTLPVEFYEQKVREARQRYPKNVQLLASELERECQAGNVTRVAELLNQAPADTANDHRFWRFKGWYHAAQEQWPKAQSAYEQALKLDALDWMSQHELAAVIRSTKGIEAAQELQQRANLGKELMREVRFAPRIDALSDESMRKMSDYFQQCQEAELAAGLNKLLKRP